jgi:hypothetical protein
MCIVCVHGSRRKGSNYIRSNQIRIKSHPNLLFLLLDELVLGEYVSISGENHFSTVGHLGVYCTLTYGLEECSSRYSSSAVPPRPSVPHPLPRLLHSLDIDQRDVCTISSSVHVARGGEENSRLTLPPIFLLKFSASGPNLCPITDEVEFVPASINAFPLSPYHQSRSREREAGDRYAVSSESVTTLKAMRDL